MDGGLFALDYEAMAGSMFFVEVPFFDDVLKVAGEFEQREPRRRHDTVKDSETAK